MSTEMTRTLFSASPEKIYSSKRIIEYERLSKMREEAQKIDNVVQYCKKNALGWNLVPSSTLERHAATFSILRPIDKMKILEAICQIELPWTFFLSKLPIEMLRRYKEIEELVLKTQEETEASSCLRSIVVAAYLSEIPTFES